jgi:choline dehydrogenase-like flavoprotein
VFYTPSTIDPATSTRMYAAPAYYLPHAHRANLAVIVSALVTKVVLEPHAGALTATGVEVTSAGKRDVLRAKKEVILAAGCELPIPLFPYCC